MLKAGLTQTGAVFGFLGHSYIDLAGQNIFGAPIMMGIMDMGMITGGALSYNHTGKNKYWSHITIHWSIL